jgi:F-type H+-transporting ATPase subunit delta
MALKSQASRRYAQALVDIVSNDKDALEAAQRDLDRFLEAVESSFDLKNALLNPSFSAADREKVLRSVMKSLALSDVMQRFLVLLVDAQRIRELSDIADAFRQMADERRGRMRAMVEAAAPLAPETSSRLKRVLEKATGRTIELEVKVDPNLIGGIRARVGTLVFDGTIRAELDRLKARLVAAD